ncbi:hypothetical protein GCM10028809_34610 [Spirosoma gilvum]
MLLSVTVLTIRALDKSIGFATAVAVVSAKQKQTEKTIRLSIGRVGYVPTSRFLQLDENPALVQDVGWNEIDTDEKQGIQ